MRCANPSRAETNARYLYARGRVVTQQAQQFFRRAVEIDPNLEVAQFHVALAADAFRRRRGSLDKSVVNMVIDEYERVLRLNPAHVAAWANQGYLYWLIDEPEQAKRVLERGREFKEMQRETFVAQLDQTLTRIAAEEGHFPDAYRSYMSAVTAHFAGRNLARSRRLYRGRLRGDDRGNGRAVRRLPGSSRKGMGRRPPRRTTRRRFGV